MAKRDKKREPLPTEPLRIGHLSYSVPSEELRREVVGRGITVGVVRKGPDVFPIQNGRVQVVVTVNVPADNYYDVAQMGLKFLDTLSTEVSEKLAGLRQDTVSARVIQALGCQWVAETNNGALSPYYYNHTNRTEDGVPTSLERSASGWRDRSGDRWWDTPEEACLAWAKRKIARLESEAKKSKEELGKLRAAWEAIGEPGKLFPQPEAKPSSLPEIQSGGQSNDFQTAKAIEVWSLDKLEATYSYDDYPDRLPARTYLLPPKSHHPFLPRAIHWVGGAWRADPKGPGMNSPQELLVSYLTSYSVSFAGVAGEHELLGSEDKADRNRKQAAICLTLRDTLRVLKVL
jgi:hypothetical protein